MKLLISIMTTLLVPVFIALTVVAKPGGMAMACAFVACCFAVAATFDWIMWEEER